MKQETITTICNKALSLLGEEPITSYDNDTSLAGRACRAHFDLVMATLLEEGFWTFPTVEKELEKVVIVQVRVLQLHIIQIHLKICK